MFVLSDPLSSHPARGAWIEMVVGDFDALAEERRTPQGVRGLKLDAGGGVMERLTVAPRKGCVD